jgi:hypothetical protein
MECAKLGLGIRIAFSKKSDPLKKGRTLEKVMFKVLFSIALLSGAINSYAQESSHYSSGESESSMENKVTGTIQEEKVSKSVEQKWRAGLTTGFNSPKGDIGTTTEFGITTAFQPLGQVGFGLDAGSARLDDAARNHRSTFMFNGLYNFGGDVPVLRTSYVGVGGGPIVIASKVKWGYAPLVGFDVPMNHKTHDFLSLGLTAKYLINPNTPNSLSGAAALKYWF